MSSRNVPDGDMPNLPWPDCQDAPEIGDKSLAALLAGVNLPAGPPPELPLLSDALAKLTASPTSGELVGRTEALAAFRSQFRVPGPVHRAPRRSRPLLSPLLSARAAAAAAATVISLGGLATAAYAGALPPVAQGFAHHAMGAPAAHPSQPTTTRRAPATFPAGPNATAHPAHGLCTAWAHAKAHGTGKERAAAFHKLALAAGGRGNIAAYCATVPHPGASSPPTAHPTGPPGSRSSAHPSGPRATHPAGPPATHPAGQAATHP
jgi:hypothetical protein